MQAAANHIEMTPRSIAVEILNRIEETNAFAEPLLDEFLSENYLSNIHDRRLLTQLVYGTLRMRGMLDWIIGQVYRGHIHNLDMDIKSILRISLYQLFFTERIPEFAIVDEAVKVIKKSNPRSSGLVNAILRNAIRKRSEINYPDRKENPNLYISIIHSHPLWLVERWIKLFGIEETIALCIANNEIPPYAIRVNRIKATRDIVMKELNRDGFETRSTSFSPDGLILTNQAIPIRETFSFKEGHIQVQDEASQMIGYLVNPKPAEKILDLCAGTGGKTNHLAEIMKNNGYIMAIDINKQKLESLHDNAKRLEVTIIHTLQGDASCKLGIAPGQKFNRILIDAPCSGLGTLRRNPEIKWRLNPKDIQNSAALQKNILENAANYLKKGGTLIYSTCTNIPEENEKVIADFINHHSKFHCLFPPEWIDRKLVDNRGFLKTKPHLHNADGFFGSVISKIE